MDHGREAQLLQEIARLSRELEHTRILLLNERNKVAALEIQAACTPHTNVEFSSSLSDYAEDERYGAAFKRAGLQRLLELGQKERKTVSISSYLCAGGHCPGINKTQFRILTNAIHPIDPKLLLYLIKQMNDDIDAGRPVMVASSIILPPDVTDGVRNQAISTYQAALRICYKAMETDGSLKPNPKRKQFKCDEKDAAYVLFASLDEPITSESKMKRQVLAVGTMGLLDNRLPAIEEEGGGEREVDLDSEAAGSQALDETAAASEVQDGDENVDDEEGDILDDDETFDARFDDGSTHAGDSVCAPRLRADQDAGYDVSTIGNSTLLGERFVSDEGSVQTFEADSADDPGLPLNVIVADNGEDDDLSTICARESFIPTGLEGQRRRIAADIDDEVAELNPSDKAVATQAILDALDSLPPDKNLQVLHIGGSLVEVLPQLSQSLLFGKAARLVASK